MWIRSAFWLGQPRAGQEQELITAINDGLVPAMRKFPGVAAVHALWPRKREDSPPGIFCQVIVQFATVDDMSLMLASDERAALRPRVIEAVGLFEGALSHIDYEAV
jgi:hypothetical protein